MNVGTGCVLKDATRDPSLWVTVTVGKIFRIFDKVRFRIHKKVWVLLFGSVLVKLQGNVKSGHLVDLTLDAPLGLLRVTPPHFGGGSLGCPTVRRFTLLRFPV